MSDTTQDFALLTFGMLLKLAQRIVPELARAEPVVRQRLVDLVEHELRLRPLLQRIEFNLLVILLGLITLPLPGIGKDVVLRWFENAPLKILRVGIWGLKTLIFLGYYGQENLLAGIHYEPSRTEGNTLLHQWNALLGGQPDVR
jgi:hypothetical protein